MLFALAGFLATSLLAIQPVDSIVVNARIWSDGRIGFAEMAAIDDGRFVYVGPLTDTYTAQQRIDADGNVVIPGLIDSHVHMLGGGRGLAQIHLRQATSKVDFVGRIADWCAQLGADEWVLGGRWSTESWPSREQPTREWIDSITGDRPAYLPRMDGHSALVNSRALALAGIDSDGPENPVGGVIDRDPSTNQPTGILRESAMALVSQLVPEPSIDSDAKALRRAMHEALRHGITAVSDIPSIDDLAVYEQLLDDDLPVRFFLYPTSVDWEGAIDRARSFENRPMWLQVNGLKAYLDGSLGSRTAMMHQPFCNNDHGNENWRGLWREGVEDGTFDRNVTAAGKAGLQTIVHAIGDEANHFLLNTLEAKYADLPVARCRSEHAQHLLPGDIQRFGDLGVIASMQPFHKADDGRYAEDYLCAERCESSYAYTSLLNAGAVVAFGSDWPVVSINPFLGIEAAVTGKTLDGQVWQAQENITLTEALRAYTSAGAYAALAEDEIGRIAAGYRADFVILNASPFEADVEFSEISPIAVYVEGKLVYSATSPE